MKVFFNPTIKKLNDRSSLDNTLIIRRLFLVAFFMTALGLVISIKILELALLQDKTFSSFSNQNIKKDNSFRGEIRDRNDKILASNIFKYKLKAYPKLINNPDYTVEILSKEIEELDEKRVIKQISNKSKYEVVIF